MSGLEWTVATRCIPLDAGALVAVRHGDSHWNENGFFWVSKRSALKTECLSGSHAGHFAMSDIVNNVVM